MSGAVAAVISSLYAPSGGGGGVELDAFQTGLANEELTSLTSSSWTIGSGSSRAVFSVAGSIILVGGPATVPTAMRIGGSGGSDMAIVSEIDTTVGGTNSTISIRELAAPASGSTTSYAVWAEEQRYLSLLSASFTGVDQANPSGTPVTATGTVDEAQFGDASIVVDTTEGDVVLMGLVLSSLSMGETTITAINDSTLIEDAGLNIIFSGMAMKVAGSGSTTTIGMRMTGTPPDGVGFWKAAAFVINAA